MSPQGKRKITVNVCLDFYVHGKKTKFFLCTFCAFSILMSFTNPLSMLDIVFDETLAQPDSAAVNCSDVVMGVFYSPVFTRSLIFCSFELLCHSVELYFLLLS